jgi:hypothetical protein
VGKTSQLQNALFAIYPPAGAHVQCPGSQDGGWPSSLLGVRQQHQNLRYVDATNWAAALRSASVPHNLDWVFRASGPVWLAVKMMNKFNHPSLTFVNQEMKHVALPDPDAYISSSLVSVTSPFSASTSMESLTSGKKITLDQLKEY